MDAAARQSTRRWGAPPFRVALVHGGPGAGGEMAPVARHLSGGGLGILEPHQTAPSLEGQVEELAEQVRPDAPVALVGYSWGAMLGVLTAAAHPDLFSRLILVGSGSFRDGDGGRIRQTRLERLGAEKGAEFRAIVDRLEARTAAPEDMGRLGALAASVDQYDATADTHIDPVDVRGDIYERVWPQAAALRASGELLERAALVRCPVLVVHGAHDPHPVDGVREPLTRLLDDVRVEVLPRCGHTPWVERHARDDFYRILECELAS